MKLKPIFAAAAATLAFSVPAIADIIVSDPYARSSGPTAKSGAAFLVIENTGDTDDHLIAVMSDFAKRTELHTHIESGDGVMSMVHVEEGFAVPAGGMVNLIRGGKHVMMMGLMQPMLQDETFIITLIFRDAGEVTVTVPVDLARKPMASMSH
jgi:periplasmic copper chaperone A